ncbi:hypothetical protein IKD56_00110 [bacterium]|nr:hypothetical protein [bacterium]MBR2651797.1 hypothetical protein [bacterium]
MDKKQNLLKNDKNKNNVCLATNNNLTHDEKNSYINICFLLYLNLFLSFLGGYDEN